MKQLVFFAMLLVSISIYGQTKPSEKETIQWIESVISTYGGDVKISDGLLKAKNNYDPVTGWSYFDVSLKQVIGVEISTFSKGLVAVRLICKGTQGDNCGRMETNLGTVYTNRVIIQITDNISEDLQKRLLKAFNHVVVLNGGKIIDDTF